MLFAGLGAVIDGGARLNCGVDTLCDETANDVSGAVEGAAVVIGFEVEREVLVISSPSIWN